jgi:hypothetical protein
VRLLELFDYALADTHSILDYKRLTSTILKDYFDFSRKIRIDSGWTIRQADSVLKR